MCWPSEGSNNRLSNSVSSVFMPPFFCFFVEEIKKITPFLALFNHFVFSLLFNFGDNFDDS